jgi:hypothetical protein
MRVRMRMVEVDGSCPKRRVYGLAGFFCVQIGGWERRRGLSHGHFCESW